MLLSACCLPGWSCCCEEPQEGLGWRSLVGRGILGCRDMGKLAKFWNRQRTRSDGFLPWAFAFTVGSLLCSIPVFYHHGCLAPIMFSLIYLAPPSRALGAKMRASFFCALAYIIFPVMAWITLVAGAHSHVALLFTALATLAPFMALRHDIQLAPMPSMVVAFIGFVTLLNVGADAAQATAMMLNVFLSAGVAVGTSILMANVIYPVRTLETLPKILSNVVLGCSKTFATEASILLKPRKKDSSEKDRPPASNDEEQLGSKLEAMERAFPEEPPSPYSADITNPAWNEPPQIKPFARHFAPQQKQLDEAPHLLSLLKWEPSPLHSATQTEPEEEWLRMIKIMNDLLIATSILASAIDYEEVRSCTEHGSNFLFTNDDLQPMWIELCALIDATLQDVSNWLLEAQREPSPIVHFYRHGRRKRSVPSPSVPEAQPKFESSGDVESGDVTQAPLRLRKTTSNAAHRSDNRSGKGMQESEEVPQVAPTLRRPFTCGNTQRLLTLTRLAVSAVPDRISEHWMTPNLEPLQPRVARSMISIAVMLINAAEITADLERCMESLANERRKKKHNSWRNVLPNMFGWLIVGFRHVATRLHADIPNLSSPAAVRHILGGWRIRFLIRYLLLAAMILSLDLFAVKAEDATSAWVYITAMLVHNTSTEATLVLSLLRIAGTVIGCLVGGLVMLSPVFARSPLWISVQQVLSYTVFLVIFEFIPFHKKLQHARLLTILTTQLIVYCQYPGADNAVRFLVSRIIAVVLGVVIAFIFQLVFFPRFAQDDARQQLALTMVDQFEAMKKLVQRYQMQSNVSMKKSTSEEEMAQMMHGQDLQEALYQVGLQDFDENDTGVSSIDQVNQNLDGIREQLVSIEETLGEAPVVTHRIWLRSLTFGVSATVMDVYRLQISVYLSLISMAVLLQRVELVRDRVVALTFLIPLREQFREVMQALGHLSKVASTSIGFEWATKTRMELLEESMAMLDQARLRLRKGFVRQSEVLRRSLETRLKIHSAKVARAAEQNNWAPAAEFDNLGLDLMFFNTIFFIFSAILDSFLEVARKCHEHILMEFKREQKWRQ